MKKILFLLFLIPVLVFCQEDQNKSAEDFVKEYSKLFEEKNWDAVQKMYAEGAIIIEPHGKVQPIRETIKSFFEKTGNIKQDVKNISTEITGPNSAIVTRIFTETRDRSGKAEVIDFFEIYILEKIDGVWKIKINYYSLNNPLIFAKTIDKKYQIPNAPLFDKAGWLVSHAWDVAILFINYFKETGTTSAEVGIMVGKRSSKTFNQSEGFDGLTDIFISGLQILSTYAEVLERDETTFKAKFLAPVVDKDFDVTSDDLYIFSKNMWTEMADYMGSDCNLSVDGDYWILSMNKK
ncbi:MAG: hypothetical protein A2W86_02250 [Bacteroidetes bacterium GWD2_45_23]|nr:MAG: hypothetical protein A2W87_00730 [Bacteroidetes bacterium GWC2_46_850]OFX79361.1 MAG: hypothetical protein A2071_12080 [Bacteroidetes bacterium GWC1_47_7]OFX87244.1 MAG: hypothetical protein A2W86_02250 [Bacteroidetes bacterium GWD2_45_23]HAR37244.1 hypothetical protein [Porphyromonadaceae bacterium]HBB01737.1 hypothetical protein [Porphyromonadaceae bacterium]